MQPLKKVLKGNFRIFLHQFPTATKKLIRGREKNKSKIYTRNVPKLFNQTLLNICACVYFFCVCFLCT